MSLVKLGPPVCPLCGIHCSTHQNALALGEGIGKEEPLGTDEPHHVVQERLVDDDGFLVHAAGDRITIAEARKLGLIADDAERARKLPEDRMAGRHMEDR